MASICRSGIRLFGTYKAQPAAGHIDMTIGLEALSKRCANQTDMVVAAAVQVTHVAIRRKAHPRRSSSQFAGKAFADQCLRLGDAIKGDK